MKNIHNNKFTVITLALSALPLVVKAHALVFEDQKIFVARVKIGKI